MPFSHVFRFAKTRWMIGRYFSDGEVFVAALGKAGVAASVVGDERRARHNGALNEAAERLRAAVRHDGEPNPPGIATTLPLVELGARLALANLHSAGDKNLIVDATAFGCTLRTASRSTARPCASQRKNPASVTSLTRKPQSEPLKPSMGAAVRNHRNAVRDAPKSLSAMRRMTVRNRRNPHLADEHGISIARVVRKSIIKHVYTN